MTNLFARIAELTPKLHGWATIEKAFTMAAAILALRPETILEVGVWGGRSCFPMALACKELGRGKVIGVDPWVAVASVQGQSGANLQWWGEQPHEVVYRDFLEKRGELGLNEVLSVQRMISDSFHPPKRIDFIHLDGNHGPQTLRDAERFGPLVPIGGMLFLDDLSWQGGFVMKAHDYLRSIGFAELYKLDTGAMLQKVSR